MARRLAAVLAAVVLLLQPSSTSSPVAADVSPDLQSVLRFRAEFGLNTDLTYVRSVERRADVSLEWGLPLTPAEAAELRRRAVVADSMDGLNARAEQIPDLAAVYFDQKAGGQIVIAIAGDPERYRQELTSLVPAGATVRMERAQHTLRQLLATHDAILADRAELAEAGIVVNAVVVDESGNRVEVGVEGSAETAALFLSERYGIDIQTFLSGGGELSFECTDRYNCYGPPLRGGIATWPPGFSNPQCSLAFIVNQSGKQRLLTAGHYPCGISGQYKHDGQVIGSQKTRSWFEGGTTETADAATIGDLTDTQDSRYLMLSCPTCYISMLGAQTSDNEGISVCLSARRTPEIRCGQMINKNASICFAEGCLVAQREATFAIYSGDSGGAAFSQTGYAYGVQSSCVDRNGNKVCDWGDTADNALYSHIQNVFSQLGGSMSIYTGG